MQNEITYRLLDLNDAKIYRNLRLRAAKEEPELFAISHVDLATKPLAYFEQILLSNWTVGVFFSDELKGSGNLFQDTTKILNHKGDINNIYICQEARGHGCGRQITEMLIDIAKKTNIEVLHLSTDINNPVTMHLYKSLGFMIYGIEKYKAKIENRYIDEALMMMLIKNID